MTLNKCRTKQKQRKMQKKKFRAKRKKQEKLKHKMDKLIAEKGDAIKETDEFVELTATVYQCNFSRNTYEYQHGEEH